MIDQKRIARVLDRLEDLERLLGDPDTLANPKRLKEVVREHAALKRLEADVKQDLIMLDLDDGAGDQIALIKGGNGAVDELVHLLVGHVVQGEDGRILNLTQRWTPFGNGAPITMMAAVGVGR